MNTNQLITLTDMSPLAWVVPLPTWPSLKLGSQPLRKAYTLTNHSSEEIRIIGIGFDSHEDDRIGLAGGSAYAGLVIRPQELHTISVQIMPRRLGNGKQTLMIEHTGHASPLWTEIYFSVSETGDLSRRSSYLADDTTTLDRQRRLIEQDGHRHYARVNAREHPEQSTQQNLALGEEEGVQNNILQNPWLNSQRFDGVDPNLNPEPPLNSEARREFDNERRDQEMEKQLRLGNMPRVSAAPKPQGF